MMRSTTPRPVSGREQLFLSKTSELREGAAIRGGVPLIFPQFSGLGALPKHGFARNAIWQLLRNGQTESGAAQAVFSLQESAGTLKVWPHMFKAELIVTVSGETMQIDLNRFRAAFYEEAGEHLENMEAGLLALETSGGDSEVLNTILRPVRSIALRIMLISSSK